MAIGDTTPIGADLGGVSVELVKRQVEFEDVDALFAKDA